MEERRKTPQAPKFTFAWKALTVVISLLILYTVYHVFFGLAESVKTTPAGLVENSTSVILEGVIFRDEKPIATKNGGELRPYISNGERASVDMAVGAIYSKSANSDANDKIAELEEKLDILRKSNNVGAVSIVDIEKLNFEIDELYTSMMLAISNGDNFRAQSAEKQLLIALNKKKIYEGKVKNYSAEIKEIENELDALYNSFAGEKEYIFADNGGYFYHSCDGYEESLTLDKLDSLTVDFLKNSTSQVKSEPIVNSKYMCKFVYSHEWFVAALCENSTVSLLEEGRTYRITLFDVRERVLNMTLKQIGNSNGEETVLVFSCTTMPEDFDYTRYQSFRLDISSVEGYRVPQEALQVLTDKETGEKMIGVYVLNASVVNFKRVEIIAQGYGYYIVAKIDKSKEDYSEYLDLNDLIILDTDGMYDGKVLRK